LIYRLKQKSTKTSRFYLTAKCICILVLHSQLQRLKRLVSHRKRFEMPPAAYKNVSVFGSSKNSTQFSKTLLFMCQAAGANKC